jgi:3-hydroxyisobutyrate dehydrogenase-like beta-hydroxyacid dehydrogenase
MKVSFIGLGKMGLAMSDRILGGGHDLAVYNRTASKAADLVSRGAKQMASVADAARYGDVVITVVENDAAMTSVALEPGGLVASMPKGAIHIAMGTHSISLVKKLTKAHADAGQTLISAPVMGRPPVAAAGQLGIIAGGPADAIAKVQPLFDVMGRRTFAGGPDPVGAAAAKISVNFILACAIESMGEGFTLAEKCGVPPASFYDMLTDGLFAGPAHKIYGKIIADKAYFGEPGFSVTTGLKDVTLALAAGESAAVPLPSGNVVRDRLLSAIAHGDSDRDWSIMALEQAKASGIA